MPRSRGFWVSTDGNVSVYPASPRARLPAEKREGYPKPPKREPRSEPRRGASVLRTHAPAAALHARRSTPKGVSRRNFACSSSPARWRRCSAGGAHRTPGPLGCGTGRPLPPPPARPSPLPLLRPPPRLRRRRPAAPTCACALPLAQRRSACTTRRTPGPPRRLPPPRARPRRKGASRGPSPQPSPPPPHRRPTPPPPKPPPTDAQPHRAALYPTAPSTHLAAVRLLARLTHAYRPWAGNKHPCLGTRVPATPGLVSTQPIAG